MSQAVKVALRGGQIFHSLVVLSLSSYVAYETNQRSQHAATQINFLIFASSISIIAFLVLELAPGMSTRKSPPMVILVVQALVSFLYMAGFIALSVYLSQLMFCNGPVCMAARADAVFAAFSYAVWAASATISGIEISRKNKQDEAVDSGEEKPMRIDA